MIRFCSLLMYFLTALLWSSPLWSSPLDESPDKKSSLSVGTGFFISHDGYVLTVNHVVQYCTGPISLHGKSTVIKAKIVAADKAHDLALLKIVPILNIANIAYFRPISQPINMGDFVAVAGYPTQVVDGEFVEFKTSGAKVTGTRGPDGENGFFLFNFVAHPGYSGGPVLDASSNVMGITTSATCMGDACMDNFRKLFTQSINRIDQVRTYEDSMKDAIDTNIAVNLPTVYRFLDINNIPHQEASADVTANADHVTETAQSIVNVRCQAPSDAILQDMKVKNLGPP